MSRQRWGLVVWAVLMFSALTGVVVSSQTAPLDVRADSSAVVILVDNQTRLPVEMAVKVDTTYFALRPWCPPQSHCLYVVPSSRLKELRSFKVGGHTYGEKAWNDSQEWVREPGQLNAVQFQIREAPELPKRPSILTG